MSAARDPVPDPRPGGYAADAPGRRRRELGPTSARSLLLTVLGEFVLPGGAPVWTQVLLDVLGELGVESKSARQALARTAAEGLLVSDRDGRRVRWALTEPGRRLLSDGAARIYGFGAPAPAWDGRWLVLLASVPESRRQLRHRLRTRLAWAGLGSPAPGVWVSPDPAKEPEVALALEELGLTGQASSFVGRFGTVGRPSEVVAQAWDLERIERAYDEFLDEFGPEYEAGPGPDGGPGSGPGGGSGSGPGSGPGGGSGCGPGGGSGGRSGADPGCGVPASVLARQVQLVHAWRRFPFLDPELPAELLPERWAGARAADVFRTLHARWAEPARRRWAGLLVEAA